MNKTLYTKEQFGEYIKSLIEDDQYELLLEDKFFEKELNICEELDTTGEINLNLETTGYTWKIDIKQRDNKIYSGIYSNDSKPYYAKYVIFFRHCEDYSRVVAKTNSLKYIDYPQETYFMENYFNRERDENHLIKNNRVIFGVYLRVYKVDQEEYLNSLKKLINDNGQKIIKEEYFGYKIENWNNFSHNKLVKYVYPNFNTWRLQFHKKDGNICFRLDDYSLLEDQPPYNANIVLAFHNIDDLTCCHAKALTSTVTHFDKANYITKLPNFIREEDLYTKNESNRSIIENNQCIVGLYIRYYEDVKNENEEEEDIGVKEEPVELSLYSEEDIDIIIHNEMEPLLPKERKISSTTSGDCCRFRSFLRYAFLILIVCLYHAYYFYFQYIFNKISNEEDSETNE